MKRSTATVKTNNLEPTAYAGDEETKTSSPVQAVSVCPVCNGSGQFGSKKCQGCGGAGTPRLLRQVFGERVPDVDEFYASYVESEHVDVLKPSAQTLRSRKQNNIQSVSVPEAIATGNVVVLAVGGASRSGKGTLVNRLVKTFGVDYECVVKQDRFGAWGHREAAKCCRRLRIRRTGRQLPDWESFWTIGWKDFHEAILYAVDFKAKQLERWSGGAPPQLKDRLVIVEGYQAFAHSEINKLYTHNIFIRIGWRTAYQRRMDTKRMYLDEWFYVLWPGHLSSGQAPSDAVVIDGTRSKDEVVSLALKALGC